jgi:DNA helicase II / ATP-dependent DNA helicase PcrA
VGVMSDSFTEGLESLTAAQREAVEHVEGPLLILAGPGSGKTRVVTHRVAHLLHLGVRPAEILALTFTNKAAEEMRFRLDVLAPEKPVWIGTFHRFCARLLRRYASYVGLNENYTIYDTADSGKALRLALEELEFDLAHFTPDRIASAISWAKNDLISPDEYEPRPGNPLGAVVAKVYPEYQRRLLQSNAVDFDDLLLHVARCCAKTPSCAPARRPLPLHAGRRVPGHEPGAVRHRAGAVDRFSQPGGHGRSRPVDLRLARRQPEQHSASSRRTIPAVKVVRLEQNYRSTKQHPARAADALIATTRRKQEAVHREPEGPPVRLTVYPTQRDEADEIAARHRRRGAERPAPAADFGMFYRVNALSRTLELALRGRGVPYQIAAGGVLPAQGDQGRAGLPAPDEQPARRRGLSPDRQHAAAGHRQDDDRSDLAEHGPRYRLPLLEAARE